jgi:two-component system chemotaxis sensor kinase CheA
MSLRGEAVPFVRLRSLFGLAGEAPRRESAVVVRHGDHRAAFAVDGLVGASQSVVKPLGDPLQGVPGIAGASILGSGRVALILDVPALLRTIM